MYLPAHKLLPELFLAGLPGLTIVNLVESCHTVIVPAAQDIPMNSRLLFNEPDQNSKLRL